MMARMKCFLGAALTAALLAPAPVVVATAPAKAAVVYCKAVGVPKGCVMRPTAKVVYCTSPGLPVGCVVRPATVVVKPAPVVVAPVVVAPRAVGAPGYPGNRGGPVNRVGRR
jgi:hypothetical protein